MTVGTHRARVSNPGVGVIDISCWVDEVSIVHGRSDPDGQPDASACTLTLVDDDGTMPSVLEIGRFLFVETNLNPPTDDPVWRTRFVGRISDYDLGWEEAGEATPDTPIGQVIAVGPLEGMGRRSVGSVVMPAENDGARVARIMAAAGYGAPATIDPGTVGLIARDVNVTDALSLAQSVAADARGVLWEDKAGTIGYADAEHRRAAPVALALDVCDVLTTPTWRKTTAGLINEVAIGYGVPAAGADQPRYTATDADSVARYGRYGFESTTQLAALADATALGQLLLVRNKTPPWNMAALPIDVAGLDAADTATLLELDMHSLIQLTGMPAVVDVPTTANLWVEGWAETLAYGRHDLVLNVSGFCRTAPAPRWDDVPAAYTWNTIDAAMTWDSATCLGPITSEGRWVDVPATTKWNQVPIGVTWDTWTG